MPTSFPAELLLITDGTTTFDLMNRGSAGFWCYNWVPAVAEPKGGGSWRDSPLAEGRTPAYRQFGNVIDTFDISATGLTQDVLARDIGKLRYLLENAVKYWVSNQPSKYTWLVARGVGETNTRYATIIDYRTPSDGNPYDDPWAKLFSPRSAIDPWSLTIEHTHWMEQPPGTGTCVQASAEQEDWHYEIDWALNSNQPVTSCSFVYGFEECGYLYAGDSGAVWRTNNPVPLNNWASVALVPNDLDTAAIVRAGNGNLFVSGYSLGSFSGRTNVSLDCGASWSEYLPGTPRGTNTPGSLCAGGDGNVYLAAGYTLAAGSEALLRTDPVAAAAWVVAITVPSWTGVRCIIELGAGDAVPGRMVLGVENTAGHGEVWITDDYWTTYQKVITIPDHWPSFLFVTADGLILMGTSDDDIWSSTDGTVWELCASGFGAGVLGPRINAISQDAAGLIMATTYTQYLAVSGDGGHTWDTRELVDATRDHTLGVFYSSFAPATGQWFAAVNDIVLANPEVFALDNITTVGRSATCDDEVFVVNHRSEFNLTHIKVHDATVGYTDVFPGTAFPAWPTGLNLLLNPGFETGGTGGNFNGGAEIDDGVSDDFDDWTETGVNDGIGDKCEATATVHGGSVALKFTRTTATVRAQQSIGGIIPGARYRYSMWARGDGAVDGRYSVYDVSNAAWIVNSANTGVTGVVYTQVDYDFTAPAGCTSIALYVVSSAAPGVCYFDDTSVYLLGAFPFYLLPAVGTAVGDAIYFGIDTALQTNGDPPHDNLVFDIDTPAYDLSLRWEYYNGAWITLTVHDGTDAGMGPLTRSGVNSVSWVPPSDWITIAVDGITALWVRCYVWAVPGADETIPTQQNRDIYTTIWPRTDIVAAQVPGTIMALGRHLMTMRSDEDGLSTDMPDLWANRVIMGLRKMERGGVDCSEFTAYLNCSDEQNPPGIACSLGASTVFVDYLDHAPGRVAQYYPPGVQSMAMRVRFELEGSLARQYHGSYHAFMRIRQLNATFGTITFQLYIGSPWGSNEYWTKIKTISGTDEYTKLIDLGPVDLPQARLLKPDEYPGTTRLEIHAACTDMTTGVLKTLAEWMASDILAPYDTAVEAGVNPTDFEHWTTAQLWYDGIAGIAEAPILHFLDLILIPTDEWYGNFTDDVLSSTTALKNGYYFDLDGIENPREKLRPLVFNAATGAEMAIYEPQSPGPVLLNPQEQQRMWYLFDRSATSGTATWDASSHILLSTRMERMARYLGMRGDQ